MARERLALGSGIPQLLQLPKENRMSSNKWAGFYLYYYVR